MKIYYIDIEKFKKNHNKTFLEPYQDIEIKNDKRFFEYTIGRYLVKSVAKEIYGLKNTDIILKNNKPEFIDGGLYFNISHSKNFIVACFSDSLCGVDIEYMKKRDLEKFSKYYKREFKDLEDFYKFWTLKEAQYKADCETEYLYCASFKDEYYLTAVCAKPFEVKLIEYL